MRNKSDKNTSIKKAVLINAASKYTNVIFLLIANSILARLLTPEDHGIIAIINVFTIFFTTFSDMGLATGVIQNKELNETDIRNIFSFSGLLSLALGILFFLLSFPISWFYNNIVFITIGHLLSISVFFNALSMIPNAILMREKKFFLVAIRTVSACIISYSIGILVAYKGGRYYALVVQSITYAIYTFLFNIAATKVRPRKTFGYLSVKKILSYSSYSFGFDVLNYIVRNIDNLLTGRIMGDEQLGYYNKGYTLVLYPVNYLTNVISPVLHPILADHQNNYDYIWDKYMSVYKFLSMTGAFIEVVFVYAATEIVAILFGSQWGAAVPCVQLFGMSLWFQMTSSSCDSIYKSLGRSDLLFSTAKIFVPIQVVMIIFGVLSKNIYTLSLLVAISYIVKYFITTYALTVKGFGKKWYSMYKNVWPEFLAMGIASLVFCVLGLGFKQINSAFVSGLLKALISAIVFGLVYLLTGQFKGLKKNRGT